MKITRADVLGFCGGVRRAVTMIESAAELGPIYALHAIVHNEHVMARLGEQGVILVRSLSEIPDEATVALTAHGATQATLAALQARELSIIDATCPIVRAAQQTVAGNGRSKRFSIIYGDRGHLEVLGLLSRAPGWAVAANHVEGVAFPSRAKLAVLAQTTQSPKCFQAFAEAVSEQIGHDANLLVQDTTCAEPTARYQAAAELSERVDVMAVVGSLTSANTRNLYEICRSNGHPAHFIESADNIDPSVFAPYAHIGLTAGASTPDWVIDSVEERLRQL